MGLCVGIFTGQMNVGNHTHDPAKTRTVPMLHVIFNPEGTIEG